KIVPAYIVYEIGHGVLFFLFRVSFLIRSNRFAGSTMFDKLRVGRGENTAGYDHLQAFFNAHLKEHEIFFWNKEQKPGGRIGCRREKHVDDFILGQALYFALRYAGDK